MRTMLKGITIQLHVHEQTGTDGFDRPVYSDTVVPVGNVLVSPVTSDDAVEVANLTGKKAIYNLFIPKGDTHEWHNTEVEFFGYKWRTIGWPKEYIEEMLPLMWNRQISVERHE